MRAVLALVVLGAVVVTLSACGSGSGVFGIVVVGFGGVAMTAQPSPSPLPDGFGLGEVRSGGTPKLAVRPDTGGPTFLVKATAGAEAGKLAAKVTVKRGQSVFRVTLPPGTYAFLSGSVATRFLAATVTVRTGRYTRAVLFVGSPW